jgi:hypothetical protein
MDKWSLGDFSFLTVVIFIGYPVRKPLVGDLRMQDALAATLRQTFILSQGISCKKQRARSEDRHQIKPFPTAQLDETINLRYLTSLLFPEMGYATPIRNFYTSSGDKLDLKFAKI